MFFPPTSSTRYPVPTRVMRRTVVLSLTSSPASRAVSASTRRPSPPVKVTRTGAPLGGGAWRRILRRPRYRLRFLLASASMSGTVLWALSSAARPACTPPSNGSTRRSNTCDPSLGATRSAIDGSGLEGIRRGRTRSSAARARPTGDMRPDFSSGHRRSGTPNSVPVGSRRNLPRDHTWAPREAGATIWFSSPRSCSRAAIAGARTSTASGPVSTRCPLNCWLATLPPSRDPPSTRVSCTSSPTRLCM